MSMMNKIKQFSLTYVPGMKAVRDIRRAILDYREMKPRVDELSERLEQWKNILNSMIHDEIICSTFIDEDRCSPAASITVAVLHLSALNWVVSID